MRKKNMTRQEISDITMFDFGELWDSPEEVRDYFRREQLRECAPAWDGEFPSQAELNKMADAVIAHRWHMQ